MIPKSLDAITEADIQALIDNGVPEGRKLEYKRELHGSSSDQRKEFCYDLSAFANSTGGDILFGVDEDPTTHVAGNLVGVDYASAEDRIRAMETSLASGVSPRMQVSFRAVPLSSGRCVIIGRVPQSPNPPHMTTIQGAFRFYVRDGSGKHIMDVGELRSVFIEESTRLDRMRSFVRERVSMVSTNDRNLPHPLGIGSKLIVHYLPLQSFTGSATIDIADISTANSVFQQQPFPRFGVASRPTIDGLLYPAAPSHVAQGHDFYALLFHNGIIEMVDATVLTSSETPPRLYPSELEHHLFQGANWAERVYRRAQFAPPVYVFVTMLGIREHTINMTVDFHKLTTQTPRQLGRDQINFPNLVMENLNVDPPLLFKPMIDQLWNGLGFSRSLTYSENGEYLETWTNWLPDP